MPGDDADLQVLSSTCREARMTAQAMISQEALAAVNLAGPPPAREMVAYDDL